MIRQEINDDYLAEIRDHLKELEFGKGVLIGAGLGKGNVAINYTLHRLRSKKRNWLKRLFEKQPLEFSFSIHPRDESGSRALSEIRDKSINLVANALAQSADHIESFFSMLRTELAFYIGCLNLSEQLNKLKIPYCFPRPAAERNHAYQGLYDICLALIKKEQIVANNGDAGNRNLAIITGANQGGKSTFLRSVGLAQLMMECGMFVAAESFSANLCSGLFTHFKREEDKTMTSGKLDEEFSRMSEIAEHLDCHSMLLFNESFAATNEREGSEIARQVTQALWEKGVKVFFVTHLYEFAHDLYERYGKDIFFLRAERQANGERTFKLIMGEPLPTSYGEDLYFQIFETGCQSRE